jgi:hypothetical protein
VEINNCAVIVGYISMKIKKILLQNMGHTAKMTQLSTSDLVFSWILPADTMLNDP